MSNEIAANGMKLGLGLGALMLGVAGLVAAVNLGGAVASSLVVGVFQLVLTLSGVLVVGALTAGVVCLLYSRTIDRLGALERRHHELIQKVTKRTPTFVVGAALLGSLLVLIADKAFKGETVPTVGVGVVLSLFFWVANEMMVAEGRFKRVAGLVCWFLGLLFLPLAIFVHRAGDVTAVLREFLSLGLPVIALLGLSFLVGCLAPWALKRD